jgi:oligopeptide/dipeptide ABC transporter ATP-binding protein
VAREPLLSVEDLHVRFWTRRGTVHAVNGISFDIARGETLGIVGESGCGKSVTSLAILGLLARNGQVESGAAVFEGTNLIHQSDRALRRIRGREIAMIFQDPMTSLNPVLTIGRQIREALETHFGMHRKEAEAKAAEALDRVGIPSAKARLNDYPHQFSGGMRQRAMIAMALACDPAIVIGDEPTTALDVMVQAQILALLERLRRELGLSLVLITHDLSVIAETCDRTLIMYAGKVAEEGPVSRIFTVPRHPYTQKLLAAFPNIQADRRSLETIPGSPPDLRNPPEGCRFHPRCPFVMDVCREVVPPEVLFPDGVRVACHLHQPGQAGAVLISAADVAARVRTPGVPAIPAVTTAPPAAIA